MVLLSSVPLLRKIMKEIKEYNIYKALLVRHLLKFIVVCLEMLRLTTFLANINLRAGFARLRLAVEKVFRK